MDRLIYFIRKIRIATELTLVLSLGLALIINSAYAGEWEETLAAAKKEGVVSIWGPPGTWARKALAVAFQKSFPDIKVAYQGASGSRHWPKIARERRAGLYTIDVHVGDGTSPEEAVQLVNRRLQDRGVIFRPW